jgi:putative FmdB family regulatory protein
MPRYEYRCKTCGSTFEMRRPMAQANAPAPCPQGHGDTVKLLSTVSVATAAGVAPSGQAPAADGGGGGSCCGGGCCS